MTHQPDRQAADSLLTALDPRWDPGTGLISEATLHPIVLSLDYALACLIRGRNDRAAAVIKAVLATQFLQASHDHFGLLSRHLEELPGGAGGLDVETGEFAGARLAHLFAIGASQLPSSLAGDLREAVLRAAWGTFRRCPLIQETSRAASGAALCAIAGERLAEPRLVDYARDVLIDLHSHAKTAGISEYNSAIAFVTVIAEAERVLELVKDSSLRAAAESTRDMAWSLCADQFHPPTGQFCGPSALAEHDLLDTDLAAFLTARTGAAFPAKSVEPTHRWSLTTPTPAPPHAIQRFNQTTQSPQLIDRGNGHVSYLAEYFCFGTSSSESLAAYRRPFLAYWRDSTGQPACLRVRLLKDGRDFASAQLHCVQKDHRAIAAVNFALGRGDLHESFDRPGDAQFTASDIRLRIELFASDAIAKPLGRHVELIAGDYKAAIHMPIGESPEPDRWAMGYDEGGICFDAVCYEGESMRFSLQDFLMAVGIEIIPTDTLATRKRVTCVESPPSSILAPAFSKSLPALRRRLEWDGLEMEVGIRPE